MNRKINQAYLDRVKERYGEVTRNLSLIHADISTDRNAYINGHSGGIDQRIPKKGSKRSVTL